MTKPDLTSELKSLLGYIRIATLSQGKVKQLSFVWLSSLTEEENSAFEAGNHSLLNITGQQLCLPAELDRDPWVNRVRSALDGWISFHTIAMWSEQAKLWGMLGCFIHQIAHATHIWIESQTAVSIFTEKIFFKIKMYVTFFLAKPIKYFGYISLYFNVCILFYTTLIPKLLL